MGGSGNFSDFKVGAGSAGSGGGGGMLSSQNGVGARETFNLVTSAWSSFIVSKRV